MTVTGTEYWYGDYLSQAELLKIIQKYDLLPPPKKNDYSLSDLVVGYKRELIENFDDIDIKACYEEMLGKTVKELDSENEIHDFLFGAYINENDILDENLELDYNGTSLQISGIKAHDYAERIDEFYLIGVLMGINFFGEDVEQPDIDDNVVEDVGNFLEIEFDKEAKEITLPNDCNCCS